MNLFKLQPGLWQLHLSVLILGGTTMFPKLLPLLPVDLITARSIIAAIAIGLLLKVTAKQIALPTGGKANFHGIWIGIIMGLHWITFFHAIQLAGPAIAVTAFYCFPLLSVILESIIQRRWPPVSQLIASVAVIIGVLLLMPEFDLANSATTGVLWGVVSALFFALRNVLQRVFLSNQPALPTMFWQLLGVFALCIPFQTLYSVDAGWLDLSWPVIGGLVLLGVAFTAIPHSLYVKGLMLIPASTAGIIGSLQPLYSTLFGALLLADIPNIQTAIGAAIIVTTAITESWFAAKRAL